MKKYIDAYRAMTPRWARADIIISPFIMAALTVYMLSVKPLGEGNTLITMILLTLCSQLRSYGRNCNSLNNIAAETDTVTLLMIRSSYRGEKLVRTMVVADMVETAFFAVLETGLITLACELFGDLYLNAASLLAIPALVCFQYSIVTASRMSGRKWAAHQSKMVGISLAIMYAIDIPLFAVPLFLFIAIQTAISTDIYVIVLAITAAVGAVLAAVITVCALRQARNGYRRGFMVSGRDVTE